MRTSTRRLSTVILTVVLAGLSTAYGQSPASLTDSHPPIDRIQRDRQAEHERVLVQMADYLDKHLIVFDEQVSASRQKMAARFYSGHFRPIESLNTQKAAATINALSAWPEGNEGFDLQGISQRVGVWDQGKVLETHVEFVEGAGSRVDIADTSPYATYSRHSTSMASIIGSTGVEMAARGMANRTEIASYEWGNDQTEMLAEAAAGMQVSNHAYGATTGWGGVITINNQTLPGWYGDTAISETEDLGFGQYSSESAQWDEIAVDRPHYLMVKAAGNDRGMGEEPGTLHWSYDGSTGLWEATTTERPYDGGADGFDCIIGDGGTSKNTLTIGAIEHMEFGYSSPTDVVSMSWSAWGPTDDGRIKPDIVTSGASTRTAKSDHNTKYGTVSGTSLASAIATGGSTLILDAFDDAGLPDPLSSTTRALIIHTANEAGPAPGPDYMFGWGVMNVFSAVQLVAEDGLAGGDTHIYERSLSSTISFDVDATGTEPLVVTIAWIDEPGPTQGYVLDPPDLRLVNDIDLRVVAPGGATLEPWILNPANPSAPATLGDNVRDNVEKVTIADPVEGTYQIVISHKGSLVGGSQLVSIIVSGNRNPVLYSDGDGDSIYSVYEDVDGDGNIFDDDNDFNGVPDYLDADDDGDGLPTIVELNDCVYDGMPVNPPDANNDGVPDYLDLAMLPVELTSFTGKAFGNGVELTWTTASEANAAGFRIEQADDSGGFVESAFVAATGFSSTERTYRHEIDDLTPGFHTFQLTTIDLDGTSMNGPTIDVVVDLASGVEVTSAYPNPFSRSCRLSVTAATDQEVTIDVVDLLGREVKRISGQVKALTPWRVSVDGTDLPAGPYLLRIKGDTFVQSRSVTIAR